MKAFVFLSITIQIFVNVSFFLAPIIVVLQTNLKNFIYQHRIYCQNFKKSITYLFVIIQIFGNCDQNNFHKNLKYGIDSFSTSCNLY